MTANKVIERVDAIRPNSYNEEQKFGWINKLEEMVQRLVIQTSEVNSLSYPEDMDAELMILAPFDDLYELYLESMIDYYNREYGNYNNSAMMFQTRFTEYKKAYIRGDSVVQAIGRQSKYVTSVNGKFPDKNGDVKLNFLTEHQDIGGKLDANKLPEAINEALAKAKESGEFDGKDGKDGKDYILTNEDKENIARSAANLLADSNIGVSAVISAEQSYTDFMGAVDSLTGKMVNFCSIAGPITFYEGETYTVVFDGVSYECEAITFGSSGGEQIGISNYPYGSSGSDWFQISYGVNTLGEHGATLFTLAEGDSHTVGIYKSGATRYLTDKDRLELESQIKEIQDNPFTFDDITPEQREELKGEDGKSAYDIALETGFRGTKAEWIASLRGADGTNGKDGVNGKDGKDGKDGEDYILTDADKENIAQMASELLSDSGYLKGVTCTQAEYDAMVAAGTIDSTTLYAIVG
ncbi:MAG: hypothetical protein J6S71_00500 [Clostridia bacterium]|nr:hypothetical protein [Clostridia bacterium]